MKILAIGDPHGRLPRNLREIVSENSPNVILIPGEIPNVPFQVKKNETEKQAKKRIFKNYKSILNELNSFWIPVYILRGNESLFFTPSLLKKYKNIFYRRIWKKTIDNFDFIFLDLLIEDHMYSHLKRVFRLKERLRLAKLGRKKFNDFLKKVKNPLIIVSHAPPYGYLDKLNYPRISKDLKDKQVGSKILLRAIKKYKPSLVLCGHIHEGKGEIMVGRTRVINLGSSGDYNSLDFYQSVTGRVKN